MKTSSFNIYIQSGVYVWRLKNSKTFLNPKRFTWLVFNFMGRKVAGFVQSLSFKLTLDDMKMSIKLSDKLII